MIRCLTPAAVPKPIPAAPRAVRPPTTAGVAVPPVTTITTAPAIVPITKIAAPNPPPIDRLIHYQNVLSA